MQTEQNESVTITLTRDELETIIYALEGLDEYTPIQNKLKFLFPNQSGDLCRSSDQSPDAVGQESINSPFVGLTFKAVRQGGTSRFDIGVT